MSRTGQGHFARAFRKTAQQAITILRPTSRSGSRLQEIAGVDFEPNENTTCVWVNKRVSGANTPGGEQQVFEHWLQIKTADLTSPITPDCRIIKGTYKTGDPIDPNNYWMIIDPGPAFSHGTFSIINITVRKIKRGNQSGS